MVDSTDPTNDVEKASEATDSVSEVQDDKPELAADEVYCTSCGEAIKEQAETCPHCGVRQKAVESAVGAQHNVPDSRIYELQKIARKDTTTVALVSFLLTPAGYWMVGKTGLAIINFFTFNYFLLGFIVVPFHTRSIIKDARAELERYGEGW